MPSHFFTGTLGLQGFSDADNGVIKCDEKARQFIIIIESKNAERIIRFSQVENVEYVAERKETPKNAGARALIGGIAFGSVGAIVGAASGMGNKVSNKYFIHIGFRPTGNAREATDIYLQCSPYGDFIEKSRDAIGLPSLHQPENSSFKRSEYL